MIRKLMNGSIYIAARFIYEQKNVDTRYMGIEKREREREIAAL